MVIVRPATSAADIAACLALRFRVFVDEQRVPSDEEIDAYDAPGAAVHLAALSDSGQIVGTARLVLTQGGELKVGRVAVLREWRGKGVGRALMLAAEAGVASRPGHVVVLDAQVQVMPFYEGLGYCAEGPVFLDAGIPHRRMRKVMPGAS